MSQGSTDNSPWYDDRRLAIGEGLSGLLWSIHAKRSAGLLFAEMQAYRRRHQEMASPAAVPVFTNVPPVIYASSGYSDVRIVAPSWRTSTLANCTRIKPIAVAELMGGI